MTFERVDWIKHQGDAEKKRLSAKAGIPPLPTPPEERLIVAVQTRLAVLDAEIAAFSLKIADQPPAGIDLCVAASMRLARLGALRAGIAEGFSLALQALRGEITPPPK